LPLPGTPLAKLAMDMGRLPKDYDFESIKSVYLPGPQLSEVPSDELRKIHRRAFWGINLSFLYRDPIRFVQKYYRTFYYHPEWALKFVRALFQ